MQQEGRVDAGVAEGQRLAVDAHHVLHHRHDDVLGHVHQLEQVDAGLDAHALAHRGEHLQRGVAGAGAEARCRAVDAAGAGFDGGDGVGDAHAQVVVAVEADLGFRVEHFTQGADARLDVFRQHVAGRVGDVHGLRAVGLHQLALLGDAGRVVEVGHHQEARGVHAQLAGEGDVLRRGVRLGAVGGHVHAARAAVIGRLQFLHGAQARNQQHRDLGLLHLRSDGADVFLVAVRGEAVLQRVAAQARAVGDLDVGHAGVVEGGGDLDHLLDADLLALGVHAVAQAHVVEDDLAAFQTVGLAHHATSGAGSWIFPARISSANISAVRVAAAVMMSRLPA
ncbi:hypothetical protein D3C78_957470 [compost metagenome]